MSKMETEKKLKEIKQSSKNEYVPIVREKTGAFLCEFCQKNSPSSILEIGTAEGYSGILMLSNCDAILTTIEKDIIRCKKAEKNFEDCSLLKRVNQITGDALNILPELVNKNKKYDLIFLDGPKGQYINYLPYILKLMNKNGTIIADNIKCHGFLNDEFVEHKHRTMVVNMRKFLEEIKNNELITYQFIDMEDGILIIKERSN